MIGPVNRPLLAGALIGSGTMATNGSAVYATAAEALSSLWRQVLWRCTATNCHREILDEFATTLAREAMAVATDGRVFIGRPDRVLLLSAAR